MPPKRILAPKKPVAPVSTGEKRRAIDLLLSDDEVELLPLKKAAVPVAKKLKTLQSANPPTSPLSSPLPILDEDIAEVKKEVEEEEIVALPALLDDEDSGSEDDNNQSDGHAVSTLDDSVDDDKETEDSAPLKQVMLEDIQDSYLRENDFYADLPVLQDPARVVRTSDGNPDVAFVKQLLRGLAFEKFMCYVNTARAPLSATITVTEGKTDARKVKLKVDTGNSDVGPRQAVCVSIGVVTDCRLLDYGDADFRFISVSLFGQEARRDFTYWGLKLDFTHIGGPMHSSNGLKMTTIKRGSGTVYLNPSSLPSSPVKYSSPRKGREIIKQPVSPSKWFLYTYSSAIAFEDDVPIYDGRATSTKKGFSFKPDDWKNLPNLPRYKRHGKLANVPDDSIVSIGYSVYKYQFNSTWMLSANILFVIVLADDKSF